MSGLNEQDWRDYFDSLPKSKYAEFEPVEIIGEDDWQDFEAWVDEKNANFQYCEQPEDVQEYPEDYVS